MAQVKKFQYEAEEKAAQLAALESGQAASAQEQSERSATYINALATQIQTLEVRRFASIPSGARVRERMGRGDTLSAHAVVSTQRLANAAQTHVTEPVSERLPAPMHMRWCGLAVPAASTRR